MKKIHLRVLLAVAAIVACALLVVGCGGGGGTTGDAGEPGGAKTTLTIGFGGPLTQGDVAFGTGGQRAVQLAVSQANESQEAKDLGIEFKILDGDDQSEAEKGVTAAQSFVSDRSLVGVVGHFNSTVSIAASKVYNENNVVAISYGSTNPDLTLQGFKSIFRTCATDDYQGPVGADDAIALGYKTVAIVDDSSPYGQGLVVEFEKKFVEAGGKVTSKQSTQQKQNDFTAVVTKIKSEKPDVVYFGGTYAADTGAGALFSKQLKEGGVSVPVLGGDGLYADDYITQAGTASEGDLATCPGKPIEQLPKGQAFADAYTAMFPGKEFGGFDAFAYDAANALINAVYKVADANGVDKVTSPAGKEALIEAVAGTTLDGVTGDVQFDDKGDNVNRVITLYKVIDGAWVAQEL
ncbi:MAG: branched-chain amino acid ABC transporter substrate-binding protein [Actinomycetes bacterium]|jgi:branched-chain amino acid transport system substrate-binding protein|nr:branched-chain amino acid ABC transporter substrate-binding protein [Actinomycetes bacterium]